MTTLINEQKNKLMRTACVLSVTTALFLTAIKAVTFFLTGSVSILAGLFDSIQDMMTSVVNLIAVREATTPADKHHRFGHGKAQALGSLFQGIIISVASCVLLKESVLRLINPQPIHEIMFGLMITGIAVILTFVLVLFQKNVVQKTNSLSIRADLTHYTGDIFMNIGIMLSMTMSYFCQWYFIDSLFGICVAVYLGISVFHIFKESFNMLMDAEISSDVRQQIKKISCSLDGVYDCFDLKTRLSGNEMFAQFSVSLDDNLTLRQAHDKIDKIEEAIQKIFPQMNLVIHPEPVSQNKRGRNKTPLKSY